MENKSDGQSSNICLPPNIETLPRRLQRKIISGSDSDNTYNMGKGDAVTSSDSTKLNVATPGVLLVCNPNICLKKPIIKSQEPSSSNNRPQQSELIKSAKWLDLRDVNYKNSNLISCIEATKAVEKDLYVLVEERQFLEMVHACWWYYFSKFTEFMDTLFFVLRKKTSQVTALHVIHHGCMPMSVWFGVKFTPGGHGTFFGLLNTFVHIIMYTYYLFAAMGPQYQKFLWWKKYLTALQMVQFVVIMVHAFQLLISDCNYSRVFVWWIGMHAVMFLFLFNKFYKSTYKANQEKKRLREEQKLLAAAELNGHSNGTKLTTNGKILTDSSDIHYQNGSATHNSRMFENSSTITSTATKAADYYVRGELPTEITQRKIQK